MWQKQDHRQLAVAILDATPARQRAGGLKRHCGDLEQRRGCLVMKATTMAMEDRKPRSRGEVNQQVDGGGAEEH